MVDPVKFFHKINTYSAVFLSSYEVTFRLLLSSSNRIHLSTQQHLSSSWKKQVSFTNRCKVSFVRKINRNFSHFYAQQKVSLKSTAFFFFRNIMYKDYRTQYKQEQSSSLIQSCFQLEHFTLPSSADSGKHSVQFSC